MPVSSPDDPPAYTTNRCEHRHRSVGAAVRCALEGGKGQGWHVLRGDGTGLTRDEERRVGEHVWRYRRADRTGTPSMRLEEYERSKASDPSATAATAPAARRELGFLDGEVAIDADDDFEMTEEEFLGGR